MMELIATLATPAGRQRVFSRFALGVEDVSRLTEEIAVLRTAAYEQRLNEIARSVRLGRQVTITDTAVLRQIAMDATDSAASVLHTHNTDLRKFLNTLPPRLSEKKLTEEVRAWSLARGDWKSDEIARTEGLSARNLADKDVIRNNALDPMKRISPRRAGETKCAALAAEGWKRESEWGVSLPLHQNCVHGWEYKESFGRMLAGRDDVWIGDWQRTGRSPAVAAEDRHA